MKPLSLRASLTLFYTAMLAVLVTALGVAYHSTLVRHLDREATERLEDKTLRLRDSLRVAGGGEVDFAYDRNDPEDVAFFQTAAQFYQVYDLQDGRLLSQSPGMAALGLQYTTMELAERRGRPEPQDVATDRGRIRLSSSVLTPSGGSSGTYLLEVGELLANEDRMLVGFDRLLLWRIGIGLVIAALLGRWLAARALAPLARLATASQALGIANLHERLEARGTGDELDQVAHAFNRALTRVQESVGEMRQFSAALAHELRTPLAILRGEAELALRREASPAELQAVLANQIDEFDRMTRLINQLLTLARAEAGEVHLVKADVDLAAVASSVVEQVESVAAAQGVTLRAESDGPMHVAGDAGWLGRLVLILLDNALKFTPAGGHVTLRLTQTMNAARLSVVDTGTGISADAMPHLFERFYRADAARTRQTQGAGLGLALAKWIAERHDATIDVRSTPGEGSTFTVTLSPLRSAMASAGSGTNTGASAPAAASSTPATAAPSVTPAATNSATHRAD